MTAFSMIALLMLIACGKDNPTDPTKVNPNGPAYSRAWQSDDRAVCFWVSEDRLTVVPEYNCDDGSFTVKELPGTYTSGGSCEILFRYTEGIPIRDSKFSVTDYQPDPEGSSYSFDVIFETNTATGTVTELNRYGVTCTATFDAVAYLSTIGP